jgi:hypothetical protein
MNDREARRYIKNQDYVTDAMSKLAAAIVHKKKVNTTWHLFPYE